MFSLEVLVDNGYDNGEEEFFLPDYTAQPSQKDTEELIEYTPQISLHALSGVPHFQTMRGKKMSQPSAELSSMMLCVYPRAELSMIHAEESIQVPAIAELIQEYADVFAVPTSLPPERVYDHKIILKEGSVPVNVRPYRHPPTQKDAIENMVKELLESEVIREIQSSFASLVFMVKKKDGS
ncbi:hypothetical protein Tco_0844539 [Tanacetum coccineum]